MQPNKRQDREETLRTELLKREKSDSWWREARSPRARSAGGNVGSKQRNSTDEAPLCVFAPVLPLPCALPELLIRGRRQRGGGRGFCLFLLFAFALSDLGCFHFLSKPLTFKFSFMGRGQF